MQSTKRPPRVHRLRRGQRHRSCRRRRWCVQTRPDFVNAGMVPFKKVFTRARNAARHSRTSSQKCVVPGKPTISTTSVIQPATPSSNARQISRRLLQGRRHRAGVGLYTRDLGFAKDGCGGPSTEDDKRDLWRKIAASPRGPVIGKTCVDGRHRSYGRTARSSTQGEAMAGGHGPPDEDGPLLEFGTRVYAVRAFRRRRHHRCRNPL